MANNKDIIDRLDVIQSQVCNQDIEEIKTDIKSIKETLSDPEDGLVVRINKNTYWRKSLTKGDINFETIKDDVKVLNTFKSNVTRALWVVYTALLGLVVKLLWGE